MNSRTIILAVAAALVAVLSASVLVPSESDAFSQDGFEYEPLTEGTVAVV